MYIYIEGHSGGIYLYLYTWYDTSLKKKYSHAEGGGVGAEEQEQLLVAQADAVVHPRAVVVHLHDAPLAEAAVVRAGGLEGVAPVPRPKSISQHFFVRKIEKTKKEGKQKKRENNTYFNHFVVRKSRTIF